MGVLPVSLKKKRGERHIPEKYSEIPEAFISILVST